MKTLINSSQSGIFELEKEFLLGNNFFSISFDLFIENIPANLSLSLSNQIESSGFIWSNNKIHSNLFSIIESELTINIWNSISLIYIPSIGILYYKNKTLINTFRLEINQNFYCLKISLDKNSKIRNLIVNPIDSSYNLILHCNDSILDSNFWNVKGYISSETSNNSHFGKSLKLFFGSEISSINPSIFINNSDFTFDFYIQASSSGSLEINLYSKSKKQINNLIALKFSNKKLSSLLLKDYSSELNINISSISHITLVYYHNLKSVNLFVNGNLISSFEFFLDKKDNYFLSILSQGIFNIDEFHLCSGLAYWINNFTLPKYPYKDSISIDKIFVPNPISKEFIANSSIDYRIIASFSIKDNCSVLIEILWKSNQFPSGEFIPFSKNIYQIIPENYFSHKSDLIELAESTIKACQLYLNNLIGVVTVPDNISETYINKSGKSIDIFVEFNQKIISLSIQYIEFKISYTLDYKSILFKESNFKITSENYMNYYSDLLNQINSEIETCKFNLDSVSNKILHLGNMEISLADNNSIFHPNNSLSSNLKNLRLNLKENKFIKE